MDSLTDINACGMLTEFKARLNSCDLVVGRVYRIIKFQLINTKYGLSVLVHLEAGNLFLPKRFTSVIKEQNIEELNSKSLGLVLRSILTGVQGRTTPLYEIVEI